MAVAGIQRIIKGKDYDENTFGIDFSLQTESLDFWDMVNAALRAAKTNGNGK